MDNEESKPTINDRGTKAWRNKSGELHRLDGPAIECSDGTKEWWQNGKLHRVDGPGIQWNNGNKAWCLRGKLYLNKEAFFDALTDEEKEVALYSEDFHNG